MVGRQAEIDDLCATLESEARLISTAEAAKLAGVSPATIRKWVQRGQLHPAESGKFGNQFNYLDVARANEATKRRARRTASVPSDAETVEATIGVMRKDQSAALKLLREAVEACKDTDVPDIETQFAKFLANASINEYLDEQCRKMGIDPAALK